MSPLMAQFLGFWRLWDAQFPDLFAHELDPRIIPELPASGRDDTTFSTMTSWCPQFSHTAEAHPPSVCAWRGARKPMDSLLPAEPAMLQSAVDGFEPCPGAELSVCNQDYEDLQAVCTKVSCTVLSHSELSLRIAEPSKLAKPCPERRCLRKVRFSFSVQFWFPAAQQIVLPDRCRDIARAPAQSSATLACQPISGTVCGPSCATTEVAVVPVAVPPTGCTNPSRKGSCWHGLETIPFSYEVGQEPQSCTGTDEDLFGNTRHAAAPDVFVIYEDPPASTLVEPHSGHNQRQPAISDRCRPLQPFRDITNVASGILHQKGIEHVGLRSPFAAQYECGGDVASYHRGPFPLAAPPTRGVEHVPRVLAGAPAETADDRPVAYCTDEFTIFDESKVFPVDSPAVDCTQQFLAGAACPIPPTPLSDITNVAQYLTCKERDEHVGFRSPSAIPSACCTDAVPLQRGATPFAAPPPSGVEHQSSCAHTLHLCGLPFVSPALCRPNALHTTSVAHKRVSVAEPLPGETSLSLDSAATPQGLLRPILVHPPHQPQILIGASHVPPVAPLAIDCGAGVDRPLPINFGDAFSLMQLSGNPVTGQAPGDTIPAPPDTAAIGPEQAVGSATPEPVPAQSLCGQSSDASQHFAICDAASAICEPPSIGAPFTVFDEIFDFRTFEGHAHWGVDDFVAAALAVCGLPGRPAARVLSYEVVSLPGPQIILTQEREAEIRDSFVFDLRPFQGLLVTLDVPCGTTLSDALLLLLTAHSDTAAAAAHAAISDGQCAVHLNGLLVNAGHPLPTGAGVVQFFCLQDCNEPMPPQAVTSSFEPAATVTGQAPASPVVAEYPTLARRRGTSTPLAAGVASSTPSSSHRPTAATATGPGAFASIASAGGATASTSAAASPADEHGLFTVFDFPSQVTRRLKQPGWTDQDCLQDTLAHAWLTVPQAHILPDPIPGYQLPQILLYQATVLATHQPLVVVFQGDRTLPFVCHLPTGWLFNDRIFPGCKDRPR